MMITEVPGQVRAVARLSRSGFVSRFLQPLLSNHRKIASRVQPPSPRRQSHGQGKKNEPIQSAKQSPGSNAPLQSLAGESLAAHFHAWRGASGRRYICSVFPADVDASDAGLPDFVDAIAMAVAREPGGGRRCLSLLHNDATSDPAIRRAFVTEGLAKGAIEWHIHLLATEPWQRHAVATDIETCRFADSWLVR